MEIIKKLQSILPAECLKLEALDLDFYGRDWLNLYKSNALAVVLPKSTEDVQKIIQICREFKHPLIPSGGRTGLSAGAAATNGEIVLSLEKMNKILSLNPIDRTLHVQAGVITEKIQQTAEAADLFYPVDFASKGSSQIGGNIATNAGGIKVIKYGLTRDWVVGLTAVTGAGEILESKSALFKNQSGYDLKSLLIGSEGTLAVITEARIKLCDIPTNTRKILCALEDIQTMPIVLNAVRKKFRNLSMFEFFKRNALEKVLAHQKKRDPFNKAYPIYLLIEIESDSAELEEEFCVICESSNIADAVISNSEQQSRDLLTLRESISETLSANNVVYKNDISVPVPELGKFIEELEELIKTTYPNTELVLFGHIGDGNIHVNILKNQTMEKQDFINLCHNEEYKIFELVSKYHGSISAEHGVGLLKKDSLHYTRTNTEIELMRGIKKVFDPDNILNPGKVF